LAVSTTPGGGVGLGVGFAVGDTVGFTVGLSVGLGVGFGGTVGATVGVGDNDDADGAGVVGDAEGDLSGEHDASAPTTTMQANDRWNLTTPSPGSDTEATPQPRTEGTVP
jgi:hypothetical protein